MGLWLCPEEEGGIMRFWIQTATGRAFNIEQPSVDDVDLEDICKSLSKVCRFGGHCKKFYSVAQHCVLASYLVPKEYALEALLHDAAESYTGDITNSMKRLLSSELGEPFDDILNRIETAVAWSFGLSWPVSDVVHAADMMCLAIEKRDLMMPEPMPWMKLPEPDPSHVIDPWTPEEAETAFRIRYMELTGQFEE